MLELTQGSLPDASMSDGNANSVIPEARRMLTWTVALPLLSGMSGLQRNLLSGSQDDALHEMLCSS